MAVYWNGNWKHGIPHNLVIYMDDTKKNKLSKILNLRYLPNCFILISSLILFSRNMYSYATAYLFMLCIAALVDLSLTPDWQTSLFYWILTAIVACIIIFFAALSNENWLFLIISGISVVVLCFSLFALFKKAVNDQE